jgi:hypothetical protein
LSGCLIGKSSRRQAIIAALGIVSIALLPAGKAATLPAMFARSIDGHLRGWAGPMSAEFQPGRVEFRAGEARFSLVFLGANATATPSAEEGGAAVNFLSSGAGRQAPIPVYGAVRYPSLYAGVDALFHGDGPSMKPEYVVAPGADPARIEFSYQGAIASLDAEGALTLDVRGVPFREDPPSAFQITSHGRRQVTVSFQQDASGAFRFRLGAYDRSLPLVIDPALNYTATINGTSISSATGVVSDAHADVYVCGYTDSANFPMIAALQPGFGGGNDVFVARLAQSGKSLVWATFLGGTGDDRATGIALDAAGEVVVTGSTQSVNFPVASAYQSSLRANSGQDAFIAKLNAAGNGLVFSTYFGGSGWDVANAVTLDSTGNIYVIGDTQSHDFPVRAPLQALNQGQQNTFVAEFTPAGSLSWSTYFGGNSIDHGAGIAVDASANVYIAGSTWSTAFPVHNPFQASNHGGQDAFVAKFTPGGGSVVFSTYLGGSGSSNSPMEGAVGVGVDSSGDVYVGGTTNSMDFPLANPLQSSAHSYGTDLFISEFNPQGSALLFSTYLGGSSYDYAQAFMVDLTGSSYIAGTTLSQDLPLVNPYQSSPAGMYDGFVIKLSPGATQMTAATYLGGVLNDAVNAIGVDHWGNLYLAGETASTNFPGAVPLGGSTGLANAFITSISGQGDHRPFLNRLYQGFFNRLPDPSGNAFYSIGLDSGWTEPSVANNFYLSPEAQNTDFGILECFFAMLNVDPSYSDFSPWLTTFDQSPSIASAQLQLIASLMTNASFQAAFGGLTNAQFVSQIYQQMFGTPISSTLLSQLTSDLNTGWTRAQVIQYLIAEPSYLSLVRIRAEIDMAYLNLLERNPDPNGFVFYYNLLTSGYPLSSLMTNFVMSPEFQNDL